MPRQSVRWWWMMAGGALALLAACGEPTDAPEDCTVNEYYDGVEQLCFTCPAVEEPTCRAGCGFSITEDARGCPEATCDDTCSMCPEGASFSLDTLACVCDDTALTYDASQQRCVQ